MHWSPAHQWVRVVAAQELTSVSVSEYSFILSTATMLFSRSEAIRTIQFRDMTTLEKTKNKTSERENRFHSSEHITNSH